MRTQLFKLDLVMMAIVILCIMSAVLYKGISVIEKKMIPWTELQDKDFPLTAAIWL